MEGSRRSFLKIAGVSVLGLGIRPLAEALAKEEWPAVTTDPKGLTAKRWAMIVDMRKPCPNDCKDCIDACHRVHNVPDLKNPKDEVKWIWNERFPHAFPGQDYPYVEERLKGRPVVVLCNHCDNPPCVRVCPTKATFRRADGIVVMDYHRCIGCRFCMAGCPFGARSLNWRDPRPFIDVKKMNPEYPTRTRGVVEKCTFCDERLAKGIIPACVEACKEKLLVFGDVEDANSEVRKLLRAGHALRRKPQLGTQPQVYYLV
jgi:molybdopterin-containing oxidoreductase family iron-sulfur binding subunit